MAVSNITLAIELTHDDELPSPQRLAQIVADALAPLVGAQGGGYTFGRRTIRGREDGPNVQTFIQSAAISVPARPAPDTTTVDGILRTLVRHVGTTVVVSGAGGSRRDYIHAAGTVDGVPVVERRRNGLGRLDRLTGDDLLIAYGGFVVRPA